MNRRKLLTDAALVGAATTSVGAAASELFATQAPSASVLSFPVLDAHIHLFDPTRPGGVPWPEPGDAIYQPALPSRYEQITRGFGVVGAIAIEASPLPSDNDWVLQLIQDHPVMVGMIGDLIPGAPEFSRDLERLHRNPLFLGIRYGNLWNRDLAVDMRKPGFFDGLRLLAQAGLTFETANPNPELIAAIATIAGRLPELTIVVDHLPHAVEPTQSAARREYEGHLAALGRSPSVFVKLSEIITRKEDRPDTRMDDYSTKLDHLWGIFGPDKVLYGSDWPNSDHVASYADTFTLVRNYVATKGVSAQRKVFFSNSITAYRWSPRRKDQKTPL